LEDVTEEQVSKFFSAQGNQRLQLLSRQGQEPYKDYPFKMGLVREEEIENVVRGGGMRRKALVRKFVDESGGRVGVKEKVEEVIARMCGVDGDGLLFWSPEE